MGIDRHGSCDMGGSGELPSHVQSASEKERLRAWIEWALKYISMKGASAAKLKEGRDLLKGLE